MALLIPAAGVWSALASRGRALLPFLAAPPVEAGLCTAAEILSTSQPAAAASSDSSLPSDGVDAATAATSSGSNDSSTLASSSESAAQPNPAGPWIHPDLPRVLPRLITKIHPDPVPLLEALEKLQAGAKPRDTMEAHFKLKVDPRRGDQVVRGAAVLPFGTGRKISVAVIAVGEHAELARQHGADVVGGEELINEIAATKGGCITWEKTIATPDMMKALAKVGKILGPKGLMPSPKLGTLTLDVAGALAAMRAGRVEYRVDRFALVHVPIGRAGFELPHLYANAGALAASLIEARPAAIKGGRGLAGYVTKVHLAASQSRGSVLVLPSSFVAAMDAAAEARAAGAVG